MTSLLTSYYLFITFFNKDPNKLFQQMSIDCFYERIWLHL